MVRAVAIRRCNRTSASSTKPLWPEYQQLSAVLRSYLDEITERVIAEAIHKDTSEAPEINEPALLAGDSSGAG